MILGSIGLRRLDMVITIQFSIHPHGDWIGSINDLGHSMVSTMRPVMGQALRSTW